MAMRSQREAWASCFRTASLIHSSGLAGSEFLSFFTPEDRDHIEDRRESKDMLGYILVISLTDLAFGSKESLTTGSKNALALNARMLDCLGNLVSRTMTSKAVFASGSSRAPARPAAFTPKRSKEHVFHQTTYACNELAAGPRMTRLDGRSALQSCTCCKVSECHRASLPLGGAAWLHELSEMSRSVPIGPLTHAF